MQTVCHIACLSRAVVDILASCSSCSAAFNIIWVNLAKLPFGWNDRRFGSLLRAVPLLPPLHRAEPSVVLGVIFSSFYC